MSQTKEYTKEQKLHIVQKTMSDKELKFWCKIKTISEEWYIAWFEYKFSKTCIYVIWNSWYMWEFSNQEELKNTEWFEIIWHPVMIGDVYARLQDNCPEPPLEYTDQDCIEEIFILREYKRQPIEEQPEECISFIYNLIKDNEETTK